MVLYGERLKSFVLAGAAGLKLDNYGIHTNAFSQLQVFSLGYNCASDTFIEKVLGKTNKLVHLDLSCASLCDLTDENLKRAFLKLRTLQSLKFSAKTIQPDFISQFLMNNPKLLKLELFHQNDVPVHTLQKIANSQVQHLKIATAGKIFSESFKNVKDNSVLKVLDLSANSDIPISEFEYISQNASIRKIIMQDYTNNIERDMWLSTLFAGVLVDSLEELDISRNERSADIRRQIFDMIEQDKMGKLRKLVVDCEYQGILLKSKEEISNFPECQFYQSPNTNY